METLFTAFNVHSYFNRKRFFVKMPTVIKEFDWNQTTTHIKIEIPLKDVIQSKLSTFISPRYIKVSYGNIFFEVVLSYSIDEKCSKCVIRPEGIILELRKCEVINWDTLEPVLSKCEKLDLKKRLLEEAYKQVQQQHDEKLNRKSELKRVAVRKQIETDTEVRNNIESIKEEEKKNALGDANRWIKNVNTKSFQERKRKDVKRCESDILKNVSPNRLQTKQEATIQLPRQLKTLQINFTPREFPTPSRESKLAEENEWLSKQAAARRKCGFVSEDIRPEERSPQFLKAKGDEFLKNRNYLGAISAYSYGIQISPKFVDFYISRSEAHYALENYHKVIEDCSAALELMKPECLANLNERAYCIGWRGIALYKLGMKKEGIQEINYSLNVKPSQTFEEFLDNSEIQ